MLARTAKSCGPDAPTLASSSWEASFLGMMVARKPGHQGELEGNRNTIVQGMPGRFRRTCVTNARAIYSTRAAMGASGTRHSLRPSFEGTAKMQSSGVLCRENTCGCLKPEPRESCYSYRLSYSSGSIAHGACS
jgi:hypothetical protein